MPCSVYTEGRHLCRKRIEAVRSVLPPQPELQARGNPVPCPSQWNCIRAKFLVCNVNAPLPRNFQSIWKGQQIWRTVKRITLKIQGQPFQSCTGNITSQRLSVTLAPKGEWGRSAKSWSGNNFFETVALFKETSLCRGGEAFY